MLMRQRLAAEFIGTFALVFAGTGAIVVNELTDAITHVGVALTFGLVVLSLIYALGDVSGAHFNPAVTLGFVAARRFAARDALPYIGAQFAGACAASLCLRTLFPESDRLGATLPRGPALQSFVFELLLTGFLMFVILNSTTGAKEKGLVVGIVVGSVIGLEAMFAGPISGASMNPARSLGPAVVTGAVDSLWIYLAAPTAGALLAVPGCRLVQVPGCCATEKCP
jgi:aquaporin Z